MANNKFPTYEISQDPSLSNRRSPLSGISYIPTPESQPADGLLDSPKGTDWDDDDEFPPIQRLLERPIEVLDLTGEDPPPGQLESPCQQAMAGADGHLQGTADILVQLSNLLITYRQSLPRRPEPLPCRIPWSDVVPLSLLGER